MDFTLAGMDVTSAIPVPISSPVSPTFPSNKSSSPEEITTPKPMKTPMVPYYNGPYNPEYKPTESSIEEIFGLPNRPEKPPKDKSKSKSEAKKPLEPTKHKEIVEQTQTTQTQNPFPGPLAPNKFHPPTRPAKDPSIMSPNNPNKLPPQPEKGLDQPQFVPLNHPDDSDFSFSPSNGENIPPTRFDPNQFDNADVGPAYVQTNGGKKKVPQGIDDFVDDSKMKPQYPGKVKPGRKPEQEILPDDLLHLINLHHPGLTQLDHPPAQGHPGLYEFHQQISNQESPANQIQPNYFNPSAEAGKKPRPQIVAHKNENGDTTYHIHTAEVPNSPQQIEELLAHISQHDSNLGPYQQYPNQPPVVHNYQNGPPPPPRIGAQIPNSGVVPHLNHPFSQSGSCLNYEMNK